MAASISATSIAASPLTSRSKIEDLDSKKLVRLGIIADLHGGLAADAASRLDVFLDSMKEKNCHALIQMGDFAFPNAKHQTFADKFNAAHENTVHVIGNHEFDFGLTRTDCQKAWGIESAYYRRDVESLRMIVLDGNEKGSPAYKGGYPSYIGKRQQEWLAGELQSSNRPVIILSHQPLAGQSAIDNATEIQRLLARFKDKILLCINGHSHIDSFLQVDGVSYLHVNSASYYWVGGKTRMAYYRQPLFTTLVVDPEKKVLSLEPMASEWSGDSPSDIGYFDKPTAPSETIVTPQIRARRIGRTEYAVQTGSATKENPNPKTLKIMTWNIWGRLNQDPKYTIDEKTARQRTIDILRKCDADIIAMIETYGSAKQIAEALDFHHYTPSEKANLCIFSRYPLTDTEPLVGLSPFSFIAATVNFPNGQKVRVYDIWLTSSGRHIVEIKNKKLSDKEFCEGDDVRFEQLKKLLAHKDFKKHIADASDVPVVVAGDFNCVSHLDHTTGTVHSKMNQSRILPIKVSKAMHKAGFQDTFRQSNPDVLLSTLGHTWTTVGQGFVYKEGEGFVPAKEDVEPQYRDPYARIDYIYSKGAKLRIRKSQVISHHTSQQDRSFPEFPSDHAAVLSEFELKSD